MKEQSVLRFEITNKTKKPIILDTFGTLPGWGDAGVRVTFKCLDKAPRSACPPREVYPGGDAFSVTRLKPGEWLTFSIPEELLPENVEMRVPFRYPRGPSDYFGGNEVEWISIRRADFGHQTSK